MMPHGGSRPKIAAVLLAGTGAALLGALPASAQVSDEVTLNIMRECAKIDDPTSRLACYDNNIRAGGFDGRRPVVPSAANRVQGGGAVNAEDSSPQGFGSASIKDESRFQSYSQRTGGVDEIEARITDVRRREPGVYLLTLEGGAQWLFSDSVSTDFGVPRKGDTVRLSRAALGSFLMRFDDQKSVRVRRVK